MSGRNEMMDSTSATSLRRCKRKPWLVGRVDSAGFTLLEVLLSVTIIAMLAGIVAASLSITLTTWEKGEAKIESIERTRHLIEFMGEDIRSAFPYRTSFELEEGSKTNAGAFFGDSDRVNFISSAPQLGAGGVSTGLREVSFWVEGNRGLVMREAPLLHSDLFSDDRGNVLEIAPLVHKVKFEYLYLNYSRSTNEMLSKWSDSWGSVDELSMSTGIHASLNFVDEDVRLFSLNRLPAAVRVTMTIELQGKDETTVTQKLEPVTIPIMAAQVYEAKRNP